MLSYILLIVLIGNAAAESPRSTSFVSIPARLGLTRSPTFLLRDCCKGCECTQSGLQTGRSACSSTRQNKTANEIHYDNRAFVLNKAKDYRYFLMVEKLAYCVILNLRLILMEFKKI